MLLTPLNCVSVLTLVWHRWCTCGLGCIFSFLPQTGKRLEVHHAVVHQYLLYLVCCTGIRVISVERRTILEWPSFFSFLRTELPGSFSALWAFSSWNAYHVFSCMSNSSRVVWVCWLPLKMEFDELCLADGVLNIIKGICQRYFGLSTTGFYQICTYTRLCGNEERGLGCSGDFFFLIQNIL